MKVNIYINDEEIVIKEKQDETKIETYQDNGTNPWKREELFKGCNFYDAKIRKFNHLSWTYRTMNVLDDAKIETYQELADKTEIEILTLHNCGRRTLTEIQYNLAILGLELRKESK